MGKKILLLRKKVLVFSILFFSIISSYGQCPVDNENPTIVGLPENITINNDTGVCGAVVTWTAPTSADNCSGHSIAQTAGAASGSIFSVGTTTVTYTATDAASNTFSASFTVTVLDTQNPIIATLTGISVNADEGVCTYASSQLTAPSASDNCTTVTVTRSPSSLVLGPNTVTWTATDGSGNTASTTQTVTVLDTQNPSIVNLPGFITRGNDSGVCGAVVSWVAPTSADNCSGHSISQIAGPISGSTFPIGTTTIIYRATDGAGLTTTGSFNITINDTEPPVANLPPVTYQCFGTIPPATATDNCSGTITGTTSDNTTFNAEGTYTVTWRFVDTVGNVTTKAQTVVIDDTVAPVPNVSSLPTLNEGCSLASITPPTATDNCKGTITGTTTTVFPITAQGTTIVTWTYNDGNGNISTQTQNVILTKPSISGGTLLGYNSDSTDLTPIKNIAITSCPDENNPIVINLTNQIGTIVHWEKFEAGDTVWSIIPNTTDTYSTIFGFTTTKSTLFRVLVQVGTCFEYSNMVNVHAVPPDVPPILDQDLFNTCFGEPITLVARNGYTSSVEVGEGGDFNSGQFPDKWDPTKWKIDGQTAGAQWTAAGDNTKFNNWSGTNDAKNIGTNYIIKYDNSKAGKKFGIAHGNFTSPDYIAAFPPGNPTTLETPIFSLAGLSTAAVAFDQAYNLHAGDFAKLELSLDGGATYNITLQELIGTSNPKLTWDWASHPPSTANYYMFANDNSTFDISAYIGNENVRVKWTFYGTTDESVWAIDNITIPIKPYSNVLEWTDGIGEPGAYIVRGELNVSYTFTPSSPGIHQYGATSIVNGCRAYDPNGTALATVIVNYAYAGEDYVSLPENCGGTTVQLNAYDNSKTAIENKNNNAYPLDLNDFSDDPGTGAIGTWSVVSAVGTCGTNSFSTTDPIKYPNATNDPRATFSGDAGTYVLRWTLNVTNCYDEVSVTLSNCDVVDFDGVDDYIAFKNNYGLGDDFSIEVWVKPEAQPVGAPSNIQSIISKRNANSLINGYDLRLVGSTLTFNWNNGSSIASPYPLTTSRWYHVAVTRAGGIYRLYVDGIEVINAAGSAPIQNSLECIVGAMDQSGNPPNKPINHFSGWMDELKIWNVGLSPEHIRQMMNQEIDANGTAVIGAIVPININGPDVNNDGIDDQPLLWSQLNGYYRMNQIDCGYLKGYGGKGVDGKLRNITSAQDETAPLPYVSIRDGNWTNRDLGVTPWRWGASVWDYPNAIGVDGTPINWNIIRVNHNINSGNKDITLLGLLSETANMKLTIADPGQVLNEYNSGQGLWITHYLKLVGNIDLVGESQLLQRRYGVYNSSNVFTTRQLSESILDPNSFGYVERDQQGTQSSYNYNYWSSPVSYQGAPTNNAPFTVAQMLMDGTNSANPNGGGPINFGNWVKHADFSLTYPIKLSNYWLWKMNGTSGIYEDWIHIGSTGLVYPGEGYTMKGTSGNATINDRQNYVFRGKPNNADITLSIMAGNNRLVGNPYPSALDAQEFILDHIKDNGGRNSTNVINGTLYFWDHFSGKTHNLAEYIGGYATYTLMGGVNAISNDYRINTSGATGTKIPERFIAVSQGFFVNATSDTELGAGNMTSPITGGNIVFKNNQRAFKREAVTSDNSGSVFLRSTEKSKTIIPRRDAKSMEGQSDIDTRQKIRLIFDSPKGYHRELLVGVDPRATNSFDIGFDGPLADNNIEDMYWNINNGKFVIQGVNNFCREQELPLGLKLKNAGIIKVKLDSLENITSGIELYIKDYLTGETYGINNQPFEFSLEAGEYKDRFSLVFQPRLKTIAEVNLDEGLRIFMNNDISEIQINKILDTEITRVELYNYLGQKIKSWNSEINNRYNSLPVNVATGVYIVQIDTPDGTINKKIFIERK